MKITLAMVTSVNGHITDGGDTDIYAWTSNEDQAHFFGLIKAHSIIIMGRKTYSQNKSVIKLESGKTRFVLTRHPELYESESVPGQLEFTSELPEQLVARLAIEKPEKILVVGGSEVCSQFLKEGLIDRIVLTIEPYIFGLGVSLIPPQELAVKLRLVKSKQLNKRGTLLLEYEVVKE
jgi:dihydrofolate reductase